LTFEVLVIGERHLQELVEKILPECDYEVRLGTSDEQATEMVEARRPDLILLHLDSPRLKPLKILGEIFVAHDRMDIVGLASDPPLESVVKCMQLGVRDFVRFPRDQQKLEEILRQSYAQWQKRLNGAQYHDQQQHRFDPNAIIGESPGMKQIVQIVQKISRRKWVTVLIQGETGTGKEVVARAIHYGSSTGPEPFVEVNCTAIPENLLEAELFGFEKGAFTDAKFRKKGLFELAEGGTLFLDEIGDMSFTLQSKLLKSIEEKRFRRLGGTVDIAVKTRIVTGTNADLRRAIDEGRFRRDLFFRLNVVSIELPPLREREGDVILLAKYFLRKFSLEYETPAKEFSDEALYALQQYDWPGNVRELQHVVERAVLLGELPVVDAGDIWSALGVKPRQESFRPKGEVVCNIIEIPREGMSLKETEQRLIAEILQLTKWNKTQASQILGISRPRLNRKIEEYQISWHSA